MFVEQYLYFIPGKVTFHLCGLPVITPAFKAGMGLLRRILSFGNIGNGSQFGSNGDKKTRVTVKSPSEEDQEAVASRLLRSSSTKFAVVSELDCASLPPIRERTCSCSQRSSNLAFQLIP